MGKGVLALEEKLDLLVEASATLLRSVHEESPAPAILRLTQRLNAADACALWRFDSAASLWKPAASTVSEYRAAGRVVKMYRPAESVIEENCTLRSVSTTMILAPGTAPFEVSVMVPRMDPV